MRVGMGFPADDGTAPALAAVPHPQSPVHSPPACAAFACAKIPVGEQLKRRGGQMMTASPTQPGVVSRYIQGGWVYLRELRRSQWLSADEYHALQLRRLRGLLVDAAENVPYYRSLFQKLGATPDD